MILGIGNDLVDIRRIERSLDRHGMRFIERVFTEAEQARAICAEAAPDPDAPTGPPPAFEVTPLEAQAAALRAGPGRLQAEDIAAAGGVQADPTRAAVALAQATGAATPSDERPAVMPQGAWPLGADVRSAATPGPSLDVTR